MDPIRGTHSALTACILMVALLTAGCGAAARTVPAVPPGPSIASIATPPADQAPPAPAAVPRGGHGGRGGSAGGAPAAGRLPADWPADVPVPPGAIVGSTGSAGRWTVLLLVAGSATGVRRSTVAFYSSAGFSAVSDSVVNKANHQVTLVVENRDHSATQTNLMIAVTTLR